ncbi:ParA family protein [Spiroplasma ixodetis]|uniref:ParA family protein n=1 Tax=Spiroplasma ixodetis TaxID=2141 RepID=UPI0025790DBC|nr:AAA family ATPase [Spiroplasma ixodetis]WJG71354.1 chromosome partitioning protein [Spiroplasma ixodetis Y32]
MSKVLSFINNKGGVLKTTLTVNCASLLALQGYKVLIIDMDAQGNVGSSFGQNVEALKYTIYDVIFNNVNINDVILPILIENGKLHLLPSNSKMSFFDININKKWNVENKQFYSLKLLIELIKNDYDFIFIDSPPSMGLTMINILFAVDCIIIPMQAEAYSYQGFNRLLNYIDEIKQYHKINPKILGVLPTLINKRTKIHLQMIKTIKNNVDKKDIKIFENFIPISIKQAEFMATKNLPLVFENKKTQLLDIYKNLVNEILNK